MSKKYNTRLIRARRSYSPKEIADVFGVDKRTCFRWIDERLKVMQENTNPLLIMGYELKKFLKSKQSKGKIKLGKNEYYCLRCRRAVKEKTGSAMTVETGKRIGKENRKQLCKIADCELCGLRVRKFL